MGDAVPAKPPLSFHASGWPATDGYVVPTPVPPDTVIPMSWLKPALAVHKSAFALTMSDPFDGGVKGTVGSAPGPRSVQVDPLLLTR
ncbi:MAG: hypothetical protein E6H01_13510 [Bacillati bacterium ANGP1]|uniref:Uncharacterized protein n=1 Tax=Candidatus Segetimicrobium genomatis TaxID=2569760 RepID=A0A537KMQ1_9BACT|nr:MAG: hypothetical protein E6H01_13510 [Terrabacteria group bacterium ANGP1]